MQIVFRTDASLQIGTGHVMRCLTLAQALRERGAQCSFICREHPGNLIDQIRQRGFLVHALPCDQEWATEEKSPSHAGWLGADWLADAQESQVGAGETAIDWLIVDHYALDIRWEHAMRAHCGHIMVIDDLADRTHDCDLLLDQNLGRKSEDYSGLLKGKAKALIGPQYALLRPEFAALREQSLTRRENKYQLRYLLISMGGVDKDNATGQVLEALKACALPQDLCITVVMGPHAPSLEQVRAQAAGMPRPTEVLVSISNMAQLMADSDLAIGAAGSTSWERCCLGLFSLILVLAENQRAGAIALQEAGAAIYLNSPQDISKVLGNRLSVRSIDLELLKMSLDAAAVCDGAGVNRVLIQLLNQDLVARPVNQADEILLFTWANDTLTRQNAFCTDQISLADHQFWLAGRLAIPNGCAMFIIEKEHVPIGQVRLDRNDEDKWLIDYSVAPEVRGNKLGAAVLSCALSAFATTKTGVELLAIVRPGNLASCRVFESLGFNKDVSIDDSIIYLKTI